MNRLLDGEQEQQQQQQQRHGGGGAPMQAPQPEGTRHLP